MSYGQQSKLEGTYSSRLELQKKMQEKEEKDHCQKNFFKFSFPTVFPSCICEYCLLQ